jgi:hypothetical protein
MDKTNNADFAQQFRDRIAGYKKLLPLIKNPFLYLRYEAQLNQYERFIQRTEEPITPLVARAIGAETMMARMQKRLSKTVTDEEIQCYVDEAVDQYERSLKVGVQGTDHLGHPVVEKFVIPAVVADETEAKYFILNYIPFGRERAVTRRELIAMTGLKDRTVREYIKQARQSGISILNMQNGEGYYRPLEEDADEVLHHYRQEGSRAADILKGREGDLRWLKAVGKM